RDMRRASSKPGLPSFSIFHPPPELRHRLKAAKLRSNSREITLSRRLSALGLGVNRGIEWRGGRVADAQLVPQHDHLAQVGLRPILCRLNHLQEQLRGPASHFVSRLGDCGQPGAEISRPVEVVKSQNTYTLGAGNAKLSKGTHQAESHLVIAAENGRGRVRELHQALATLVPALEPEISRLYVFFRERQVGFLQCLPEALQSVLGIGKI